MSFAKNAADAISAARDAAVGEATGADESDAAKSKRRRIVALLASLGALGAVGTAGYYGYKNKDTIAEKGRGALKAFGAENAKPGFFGRLGDKLTDSGALTGAVVGAVQPKLTRGVARAAEFLGDKVKSKTPGANIASRGVRATGEGLQRAAAWARKIPTNTLGNQTRWEKARSTIRRLLVGKDAQHNIDGLERRLTGQLERNEIKPAAEGKKGAGNNGGGKKTTVGSGLTDFFADPHDVQARRIADTLGSREAVVGLRDYLRAGAGRHASPEVLAEATQRRIDLPLESVKPMGGGPMTNHNAQLMARAIMKPDKLTLSGAPLNSATPETMRGSVLRVKDVLSAYRQPHFASPRNIAGVLGRAMLGAGAQALPRAWSEPKEPQ